MLAGDDRIESTINMRIVPRLSRSRSISQNNVLPPWILAVVLATAAVCCAPAPSGVTERASAPEAAGEIDLAGFNLLVITIDTLRADRLGAYGDTSAETPRLDALARRGIRFESCYSHVPLTLPSHGSLFTGRYPFTHGVRNNGNYFLPESEVTLAELMAERGFETRASVATYILSAKFGLGQGFASYDDTLNSGDLIRGFSSEIPANEVSAGFASWLQGRSTEQPFFAWVHFYDPHQPYRSPTPFAEHFEGDPYGGEVAFVDREVGTILDALEAGEIAERTLVVVTSDHGEGFGEHGEVGHGLLAYEEDLRVPLIFAAGSRLTPRTIRGRVRLIDLMPTLLDLYRIAPPAGMQGESFAPWLTPGEEVAQRDVYFESMLGRDENNWAPLTGLIVGEHKYISLPERELYDLEADPGESKNLFGERRNVVREVDRALRELLLASPGSGEARRDRSGEDLAHLEALGYISGDSAQTAEAIDPKEGVRLERELQKVREQVAAGDLDEAAAGLARLSEVNQRIGVGSYYFLEHQIQAGKNNAPGAIAALKAGMERFPESDRFPFLLAYYRLQLGQIDQAERQARAVLAKSPKFSQAMILLGRALAQKSRPGEAITHYRAAYELEPRNVSLGIRLAEALVRSGDGAAGFAIYGPLADAGALDDTPDEIVKVAMLSSRFGQPEHTVALFRRVLELRPAGIHHLGFALVLARQGQITEAIEQMETALGSYRRELGPQQIQMAERALEEWRRGR